MLYMSLFCVFWFCLMQSYQHSRHGTAVQNEETNDMTPIQNQIDIPNSEQIDLIAIQNGGSRENNQLCENPTHNR